MRQFTTLLLTVFLLVTTAAWAQQPLDSGESSLLVRLSYERSPLHPDGIQRICISVLNDGNYRIVSLTNGANLPVRLKGKMGDDPLLQLKRLLALRELRSVSPNSADIIRDHAEKFAAEISRVDFPPTFKLLDTPTGHPQTLPGPPRRVQWLNADDESPFPVPIAKLIDWMERFKAENAENFDYSEFSNVCPSVGLSLVQPSVAANGPH
jgi:hypothetical protein